MLDTVKNPTVNGIDLALLGKVVEDVERDPANGMLAFQVTTRWKGGTRTEAEVGSVTFGRETIARDFTIAADEPTEIGGTNTAANPQELLMAAFNACISVGYVAGAAMKGINLDKLEIRTSGQLDLRGFFGLSDQIAPGYEELTYDVTIAGDGSAEDFAAIHDQVMKTSPNYFNLARPIRLNGRLTVA
jgi:uncharacterized OsmC-like protein